MAAAALALARAARAQLQALRPTVEQQQAEIEHVQLRASECGMVEKTAGKSGVAGMMQRAWKKWITSPLGGQAAARVEVVGGTFLPWTRLFRPLGPVWHTCFGAAERRRAERACLARAVSGGKMRIWGLQSKKCADYKLLGQQPLLQK